MKGIFCAVALSLLAWPVFAVQPDEILADPALEARARQISQGLRCPVCRNENIDDSNAGIARDLRLLLRERLVAGDTDEAAVDYIVERYGEYVLLRPPAQGTTIVLWAAGPGLFLVGLLGAGIYLRRRRTAAPDAPLTEEERRRLAELTARD
ncbi:cytochrome c-type biogenesis protein [Falsirhodobacter sp. alg1]|uniref:cytochrome c-type biogenesis protein n=1 Tax=Falsirhodobacter sp. alg1 TaxID=1472418 RepID=UPI0005ED8F12|nr:cytochrome c-type biogenesis protein [Falsirhodobacter sp. alg1]